MITATDNNLPFTACGPADCETQSVNGMSPDTQHRPEKEDQVRISDQARERLNEQTSSVSAIRGENDLTQEEKREVEKLKKTDQDVKAHENAHMSAGSDVVVGGASYEYERGPDGKMYAVGGEVKIDTSRENSPEVTVRKMQKVRRAALAPAHPSAQDRSVAARAAQIEAEARIEAQEQKAKEAEEEKHTPQGSIPAVISGPFFNSSPTDPIGQNIDISA